jgi:hypothetical protein
MSKSPFFANLKKAAFDRETLTIGGGEFDAKEIYQKLENMRIALEGAICRVKLANQEGDPILSAWLPDAIKALEA